MSNIALVWNEAEACGDWQVRGGRLSTGHALRSAVLISLFTDRRDFGDAGTTSSPERGAFAAGIAQDPRGWWHDSLAGVPIGSRLWQLRRRKVADRAQLVLDAEDICREALQWMIDDGLAASVQVGVTLDSGRPGTVLRFAVQLFQPGGAAPVIRALWRAEVGGDKA